jgi:hypothetical protein
VLKARYYEFCDNDYDPDGIASLFIGNGVWGGGFMGRFDRTRGATWTTPDTA